MHFKFKLAAKVRRILKRLSIKKEETNHFNLTNKHDHSIFPFIPVSLPTGPVALAPAHADSTVCQSDAPPSNTVGISSPEDSGHHADVGQSSGSLFYGANGVTIQGGAFYAVRGNVTMTTQQTDSREIIQTAVACVLEILAQTNNRRVQKLEEIMGHLQLPPTISVGFISIMDATGRQHQLMMNMAGSFKQFNRALRVLFARETPHDRVLNKYMDTGAYDLCIDDGKEEFRLTNQEEWSSIVQCGTTVIMSIVMVQLAYHKKYQCPFCDFWNKLEGNYGGSSIDCRSCKRFFHVTMADQNSYPTVVETEAVSDHEWDLIRNIHLKRGASGQMKGLELENSDLSEQVFDSGAAVQAARLAEKTQRAAEKKKKKKKSKVMQTVPYVEEPVANTQMDPTPILPPSMLPVFQSLPFHPQQVFSPYGYFYSPPYPDTPPMGSVYHGQPYMPPMPYVATNVNCFNNSKISGGISISNTTMNMPYLKPGPQQKRPRR